MELLLFVMFVSSLHSQKCSGQVVMHLETDRVGNGWQKSNNFHAEPLQNLHLLYYRASVYSKQKLLSWSISIWGVSVKATNAGSDFYSPCSISVDNREWNKHSMTYHHTMASTSASFMEQSPQVQSLLLSNIHHGCFHTPTWRRLSLFWDVTRFLSSRNGFVLSSSINFSKWRIIPSFASELLNGDEIDYDRL